MLLSLTRPLLDPKYEDEVSGCTASVGIISMDKIRVVCLILAQNIHLLIMPGKFGRFSKRSRNQGQGKTAFL